MGYPENERCILMAQKVLHTLGTGCREARRKRSVKERRKRRAHPLQMNDGLILIPRDGYKALCPRTSNIRDSSINHVTSYVLNMGQSRKKNRD